MIPWVSPTSWGEIIISGERAPDTVEPHELLGDVRTLSFISEQASGLEEDGIESSTSPLLVSAARDDVRLLSPLGSNKVSWPRLRSSSSKFLVAKKSIVETTRFYSGCFRRLTKLHLWLFSFEILQIYQTIEV